MLVDYSDSESDSEVPKTGASPFNPSSSSAKSSLSTLLPKPKSRKHAKENSNEPKKIVVNLPQLHDEEEERPMKKPRTSGGGSGLSSMLPAPKRAGGAVKATAQQPESDTATSASTNGNSFEGNRKESVVKSKEDAKPARSSTMFVPQSVAKKPIQPTSAFKKSTPGTKSASAARPVRAKTSLFGSGANLGSATKLAAGSASGHGAGYEPIMLEAAKSEPRPSGTETTVTTDTLGGDQDGVVDDASPENIDIATPDNGVQDLESLARQSGLDDVAMRQLYGRRGRDGFALANISTFSVDDEYAANEARRVLGEAADAKPVKSVAPGKHQLRSLLNVAQAQKGALEESFAQGKRNRKEAGSKYGW